MTQGRGVSQPSQKRARSGAAKERDRPPDRLSRKNGMSQKQATIAHPRRRSARRVPILKRQIARKTNRNPARSLAKVQGGHPPGGQPVETLYAPGDVGPCIAGKEVAPE